MLFVMISYDIQFATYPLFLIYEVNNLPFMIDTSRKLHHEASISVYARILEKLHMHKYTSYIYEKIV